MRGARTIHYSFILGGLLCTALAAARLNASPPDRPNAQDRPAHHPSSAHVECLARTIQTTPPALRHAQAGAWTQAVGMIGYQCAVSGAAYWADLPRDLAAQLKEALAGRLAEGGQAVRQHVAAR